MENVNAVQAPKKAVGVGVAWLKSSDGGIFKKTVSKLASVLVNGLTAEGSGSCNRGCRFGMSILLYCSMIKAQQVPVLIDRTDSAQ